MAEALSLYRFVRNLAAVALVVGGTATAFAGDLVNTDRQKVAIKGYDTVAYFTDGKAVKGSAEFETTWRDARWRFSSADHRDLFLAEPEKYEPRYGGFCALAVAKGQKADIDPEQWSIVDGRLYLNYDRKFRDQWRQSAAAHIAQADKIWPSLK